MSQTIFYVGTEAEVAHHAEPLSHRLSNLRIADPNTVSSRAKTGDLAVFYSEHFDRFRDLCVQLKAKRIPTIYAIDGILEWRNAWVNRQDEIACPWTMRPCLSDVVASIGRRQSDVLRSWGNVNNVYTIGIPRFDSITNQREQANWNLSRKLESSDSKPIKLLVITAKCPGFTQQQLQTTQNSLRALKAFTESENSAAERSAGQRKWELKWRLTGGLEEKLGVPVSNESLMEQIQQADIILTTASTVLLESMLTGKPTVLLDFHQTPAYVPTIWTIQSADQIGSILNDVLHQEADSPKRAFQDFLLTEALAADSNATQRMLQLIDATLQRAEQIHKQNLPWQFADLPISLNVESFEVDSNCANVATEDDRLLNLDGNLSPGQLQAYANQLKRENDRLNGLLDEAHQVFDHMQGHPVLGTILKTHKWFSEQIMKRPAKLRRPDEMEQQDG